jgi:hypothetical protein
MPIQTSNPNIPLAGRMPQVDIPDMASSLAQGLQTGNAVAQIPYKNALLNAEIQGQQIQNTQGAQEVNANNLNQKAAMGQWLHEAAKSFLSAPQEQWAGMLPQLKAQMESMGIPQAMGLDMSQLDDGLDPDELESLYRMTAPYAGIGKSQTEAPEAQQNLEYWMALPQGSDAWTAFGKKNGFLDSDKDLLSITKLEKEIAGLDAESGGRITDPVKLADMEGKLRKEVLDRSKEFEKVDDAFGRVKASVQDPSPAGDLALIFNYMKMLDPGSTVREGEFANAQNAGSADTRIVALYNSVVEGTRLEKDQREDFLDRSEKLYGVANAKNQGLLNRYKTLAEGYGLNPESVILPSGASTAPIIPEYREGDIVENAAKQKMQLINNTWVPLQ